LIEHQTFRLRAGVDEDAFVAIDARVQTEVVYQQPGLVRRTTARGADGDWLVETWWNGEPPSLSDPLLDEWRSMIDGHAVKRYDPLPG